MSSVVLPVAGIEGFAVFRRNFLRNCKQRSQKVGLWIFIAPSMMHSACYLSSVVLPFAGI
jgi:hypothetical protein